MTHHPRAAIPLHPRALRDSISDIAWIAVERRHIQMGCVILGIQALGQGAKAMKKVLCGVLGLIIGAIIGISMSRIGVSRMRPPLFEEYEQTAEEIYDKYLATGKLPEPGALSPAAQRLMSENPEIKYTVKDGLSYRYDKPYPRNIPFTGLMTFGLWWGGEQACVGRSYSPESIANNAQLRASRR